MEEAFPILFDLNARQQQLMAEAPINQMIYQKRVLLLESPPGNGKSCIGMYACKKAQQQQEGDPDLNGENKRQRCGIAQSRGHMCYICGALGHWAVDCEQCTDAISGSMYVVSSQALQKQVADDASSFGCFSQSFMLMGTDNYFCHHRMDKFLGSIRSLNATKSMSKTQLLRTEAFFRNLRAESEARPGINDEFWKQSHKKIWLDAARKYGIDEETAGLLWQDVKPSFTACPCFESIVNPLVEQGVPIRDAVATAATQVKCPYQVARRAYAAAADFLIINYNLLCTLIAHGHMHKISKSSLVFDEAHELYDNADAIYATKTPAPFNAESAIRKLEAWQREHLSNGRTVFVRLGRERVRNLDPVDLKRFADIKDEQLAYQCDLTFLKNVKLDPPYKELEAILQGIGITKESEQSFKEVYEDLAIIVTSRQQAVNSERIQHEAHIVMKFFESLEAVIAACDSVTWQRYITEIPNCTPIAHQGGVRYDLCSKERSAVLAQKLWSVLPHKPLLMSATMTVNRSFDHIAQLLGIDEPLTCSLPSAFDDENRIFIRRMLQNKLPRVGEKDVTRLHQYREERIQVIQQAVACNRRSVSLVVGMSITDVSDTMVRLKDLFPTHVHVQFNTPEYLSFLQSTQSEPYDAAAAAQYKNTIIYGFASLGTGVNLKGMVGLVVILKEQQLAYTPRETYEREVLERKDSIGNAYRNRRKQLFEQTSGRLMRGHGDHGMILFFDSKRDSKWVEAEVVKNKFGNVRIYGFVPNWPW